MEDEILEVLVAEFPDYPKKVLRDFVKEAIESLDIPEGRYTSDDFCEAESIAREWVQEDLLSIERLILDDSAW